jgi:RNase P subunit RPR2
MAADQSPLFCDRCSAELIPGKGNFYVVKIEAVADPAPPNIDEQDLGKDLRRDIEQLVQQMRDVSSREAMDQVHRRLTIFLCLRCYTQWIENPTG